MSYVTPATLDAAFGAEEIQQLADRDRDGMPDADFLDSAIRRTEGLIDGYLIGRYALPLAAVPAALAAVACDIARYFLYEDGATEYARNAYEDALRWLRDAAAGKVLLALPTPPADAAVVGSPDFSAPARLFDAATLERF